LLKNGMVGRLVRLFFASRFAFLIVYSWPRIDGGGKAARSEGEVNGSTRRATIGRYSMYVDWVLEQDVDEPEESCRCLASVAGGWRVGRTCKCPNNAQNDIVCSLPGNFDRLCNRGRMNAARKLHNGEEADGRDVLQTEKHTADCLSGNVGWKYPEA